MEQVRHLHRDGLRAVSFLVEGDLDGGEGGDGVVVGNGRSWKAAERLRSADSGYAIRAFWCNSLSFGLWWDFGFPRDCFGLGLSLQNA